MVRARAAPVDSVRVPAALAASVRAPAAVAASAARVLVAVAASAVRAPEARWVLAAGIAAPTSVLPRRPSASAAKKGGANQEHKPRGPIKERSGGRIYAVDDLEDDSTIEIDDIATSPKDEVDADAPETPDVDTAAVDTPDDDNES